QLSHSYICDGELVMRLDERRVGLDGVLQLDGRCTILPFGNVFLPDSQVLTGIAGTSCENEQTENKHLVHRGFPYRFRKAKQWHDLLQDIELFQAGSDNGGKAMGGLQVATAHRDFQNVLISSKKGHHVEHIRLTRRLFFI